MSHVKKPENTKKRKQRNISKYRTEHEGRTKNKLTTGGASTFCREVRVELRTEVRAETHTGSPGRSLRSPSELPSGRCGAHA